MLARVPDPGESKAAVRPVERERGAQHRQETGATTTIESLRRIVEKGDTRAGRAFDWTVQGLVLVSLVSFSLETLPHLSPLWRRVLDAIETTTVAVFTLEYLLRVFVA